MGCGGKTSISMWIARRRKWKVSHALACTQTRSAQVPKYDHRKGKQKKRLHLSVCRQHFCYFTSKPSSCLGWFLPDSVLPPAGSFIRSFNQHLGANLGQIIGWDQIAQEQRVLMFGRWWHPAAKLVQMIHPTARVTWRPRGILMSLGLFNIHHQMWPVSAQGCARSTHQIQTSCDF